MFERIRLRPLRETDLAPFLAYRSDPEVARLQGWERMSRPEAAAFIAENAAATGFVPGKWIQVAIADSPSDRLIGDLGVYLSPDRASAEFGITITPDAQGKGYATEAIRGLIGLLFSTTPVTNIVACADVRNAPCLAALQRAGMTHEGSRPAEYKGETCTESLFSIRRTGDQRLPPATTGRIPASAWKLSLAALWAIVLVAAFATTTPKPWTLTILGAALGCVAAIFGTRARRAGVAPRATRWLGWLCGVGLLILAMAVAEDMFLGAWAAGFSAYLFVASMFAPGATRRSP